MGCVHRILLKLATEQRRRIWIWVEKIAFHSSFLHADDKKNRIPKHFKYSFGPNVVLFIYLLDGDESHWGSVLDDPTMPCCRNRFLKIWFLDFQSSTWAEQTTKANALKIMIPPVPPGLWPWVVEMTVMPMWQNYFLLASHLNTLNVAGLGKVS